MLNSSRTGDKSKILSRRLFMLSAAKIFIFGAIISRLFSLQISQNKKYKTLSDKNRIREWKLPPKRGIIKDFFGTVIAENTQSYELHIIPEDVVDFRLVFFRLKKIINLTDAQIKIINKKIKKQKPWEPVVVLDNLKWPEFARLHLFLHELSGITPVVSIARKYPMKHAFSHTVGYVSLASKEDLQQSTILQNIHVPGLKIGKYGLEKSLNADLFGSGGFQRYEVNAYGKRIKEIEIVEGKVGKNIRTTFDTEIQNDAINLLEGKSGSLCIMDIYTGHIIAMASSPAFDSNKFVHGISKKDWQDLIYNKQKPLLNKSISGLYPPGSTIKPIVALSALEHDVITPKLVIKCEGHTELYGQKYHCWKEKGHGFVGLRNAIKQSCDIYFYEVARRLGVDRLSVTAKKFGLGSNSLEVLADEKRGIVPSTKWKKKYLGRSWLLGETLISGIGQGYFQSTPLQLCLMMAQLANGGYKILPIIIDDGIPSENILQEWEKAVANSKNNITLQSALNLGSSKFDVLFRNPENVKFVTEAMFGATNEVMGTSYKSRHKEEKYIYAGKTGTSQVRKITEEQRELKIKNEDLPYEQRDHALYVAFAPYKNPRYALSIVIEHGGTGSSGAAPIAKKIIKKVIDRHELRMFQEKNNLISINI